MSDPERMRCMSCKVWMTAVDGDVSRTGWRHDDDAQAVRCRMRRDEVPNDPSADPNTWDTELDGIPVEVTRTGLASLPDGVSSFEGTEP